MSDMNSKIDAPEKDLKSVSQEALKDEEARKKLLGVVMQAMATVEAPIETIWRMIMSVGLPMQASCWSNGTDASFPSLIRVQLL